jgi:hypothetical protein
MNPRGTLVVLVLLATILVDGAAVVALAETSPDIVRWPHPILGLFLGLAFSQVNLAAVWVGLSRQPVPWPPAMAFVAVLAWSKALGYLDPRLPTFGILGWSMQLALQALLVIGAIWFSHLVQAKLAPRPSRKPQANHPVQFSVGYIFGWMTALALVLGSASWLLGDAIAAARLSDAPRLSGYEDLVSYEELVLGVLNGLIGLAIAWAVLKPDRPILRLSVSTSAMIFVLAAYIMLASTEMAICLALSSVTHAALLAATLWVFRIAGYGSGSRRSGEGSGTASRVAGS